ncbi:hypothetical protein PybrP1_008162 [[Pythium] brassicae (nom. inval.)]|nr:hypothetical protein PybrP1_008162 [[Pythium] brassicae (nom. inval.)]
MAAMYTKMTSTGSALIVNPRTISKELEGRIAASIAGVIAKHDAAKLTTKLVRQAVEKDVHVSLANHKELLKRLMHQEFRKLKAAKVAKRVAPLAWKSTERRDAMRRGMNRVFVMLRDDSALFSLFGVHAMQTLYDLQAVETGNVQRLATLYLRMLGALWLKSEQLATPRVEWLAPEFPPSPEQVVDTLKTLFVTERVGNAFSKRIEFLEFFGRPTPVYSAVMANALVGAYYARLVNVSLGCSLEQELLPHEYFFLRHHLVYHLAQQDIVLTSETLRALKSFDGAENLVQVRRGMAFLLAAQRKDGAWSNAAAVGDTTRAYFSTIGAVAALAESKALGFAPSVPELTPLLEAQLNADFSASVTMTEPERPVAAPGAAAAPLDTGAGHEDLQTQVLFLQGMLEKGGGGNVKSASAALATHVVDTLAGLPLTVEILKTTGVGRVINKLRKHEAPHVAKSATQLVAQWKKDLL